MQAVLRRHPPLLRRLRLRVVLIAALVAIAAPLVLAPAATAARWIPPYEQKFMHTCQAGNRSYAATCACIMRILEARMTFSDVATYAIVDREGFLRTMKQLARRCGW